MLLADQDPRRWDAALVAEGHALVRACLRRDRPGPYQIQAAIQAVHTDPPTDWHQVLALHDQLLAATPTAVVALDRVVAVAEARGPAVGLALVDELDLDRYPPFHAVRAAVLRCLDRPPEAAAAYDAALARTEDADDRAVLERLRGRWPAATGVRYRAHRYCRSPAVGSVPVLSRAGATIPSGFAGRWRHAAEGGRAGPG